MSDRLLTTREAAERLGRSRDFIMGLIRSRRLSTIRVGGRYYIHEWSLEALLAPKTEAPRQAFPEKVIVRSRRVA